MPFSILASTKERLRVTEQSKSSTAFATLLGGLAILFWASTFGVTRILTVNLGVYRMGAIVFIAGGAMSYLIPLLSTAMTAIVLRVHTTMWIWASCALVIGGAVMCRFSLRPPEETCPVE